MNTTGQPHVHDSKSRQIHTTSLAVARTSPSGLRSIALSGDPWASIKLTFPLPISTICSCPGVLPGKASTREPKQQSPRGLSAVSNTDSFSGGEEKAYMWILFWRAMMILERDSRTRWTCVRNSSEMTAFCLRSSQIMTFELQSINSEDVKQTWLV